MWFIVYASSALTLPYTFSYIFPVYKMNWIFAYAQPVQTSLTS